MTAQATHQAFASCTPGLEPLVVAELRACGVSGIPEPGGVAWEGDLASVYRANLWLRIASRVTVRAASFSARSFFELERHARQVPWARFVSPGQTVSFRVTSRKSRLYHTDAIAERLAKSVTGAVRGAVATAGVLADDEADDADLAASGTDSQGFVVRVIRDRCTVSADSSGALLYLRGWRLATARAPLRETLAAAVVAGSLWDPATPFLDPMCGSGTLAIEAALVARGIAPGISRDFAFSRWPGFDREAWRGLVDEARGAARPPGTTAPIRASDRDEGAVTAARANAERAGVGTDVRVETLPLSAAESAGSDGYSSGALVTNPPYGVRVGDRVALRDLYAAFGRLARARFPGWQVAFLSADPTLTRQTGLDVHEAFRTTNGGIPVRLMRSSNAFHHATRPLLG